MDLRELPYFHKGAQIALDNILDDYLGNPEMSLLEVIVDLEDNRPVVGVVKEPLGAGVRTETEVAERRGW